MGRKQVPGLIQRAGIWHIDKRILGRRVCQSTGTDRLEEAERQLARVMEETRQAQVYGVRPSRSFEAAAAKFVLENQHKRSLHDDISHLKQLLPWLGTVPLDRIHLGTLQSWIDRRRKNGKAVGTINHGIKVVRRILNLAATEWVDEHGLTWLHAAPKLKLLPDREKRQPYPLSWSEQAELFRELPAYLAEMALFAVNTGCRDQEVCNLRWEWEVAVPELWHQRIHHSWLAGEERRRAARSHEHRRRFGRRGSQRTASRARVLERRQANRSHAHLVMETGSGQSRSTAGARSRPEAHVWPSTKGSRREL